MCRNLLGLKRNTIIGDWVLGGDFNSVKSSKEIKGVSERRMRWEMHDFRNIIEDMDLVDVPRISGIFTWSNGVGNSMSRLYRFLLSKNLVSDWKIVG